MSDAGATAPDRDPAAGDARGGPSPRAVLLTVGFSVFVAADDLTVVSTMLRPMIGDLGLRLPDGLDDAAWIVNAYLIAFIAIMPIAGRVSDVVGRRRTFLAAWAVFGVGTVVVPLSGSLGPLLVGRVLTALGGGAMVPVALAVVGDAFDERRRARALGTLGAIETLGWVWGPLYGAVLVRFLGWRWQFWLNVPLAVIGAIACARVLAHHDRPERSARVDVVGAALATTALVALNLALLGSAEVQSVRGLDELTGGGGPDLRPLLAVALAAAVGFVVHQRRRRRAGRSTLVDADLLRGRAVRLALVVNLVVGAGLVIAMVDVPLFVNAVEVDLERSAVVAGWILSALTAAMAVASYVGGRAAERWWHGPPTIAGLAAAAVAFTLMGTTWEGGRSYALLAAQLGLLGAGLGLTLAPTTSAVVDRAAPQSRGAAAAVVLVVRMVGLSVGLSALTAWGLARFESLRADLELPPVDDPGFRAAVTEAAERLTARSIADTFLASAVVVAVALVPCVALLRRRATTSETAPTAPTPTTTTELAMTDDADGDATHDATPDDTTHDDGATDRAVPDRAVPDRAVPDGAAWEEGDVDAEREGEAAIGARDGFLRDRLGVVVAALAVALVATAALALALLAQVRSQGDELAETRDDLDRVEAGAALFAAQVNDVVASVDELGPSIDSGLEEAITGLEGFRTSTIDVTIPIDETISLSDEFTLQRTVQVPIETSIPIREEVDTTITVDGPFGIDIPLDITVPVDLDVPIDLTVDIPIDETVPIDVDVPVRLDVPISIQVEGTELDTLAASLVEGLRAFQAGLDGLTGG